MGEPAIESDVQKDPLTILGDAIRYLSLGQVQVRVGSTDFEYVSANGANLRLDMGRMTALFQLMDTYITLVQEATEEQKRSKRWRQLFR